MLKRRFKFRWDLNGLYLPFYDQLCELLDESWQPYQGTRTVEAQQKLYDQGRKSPGKIVTYAQGGESPHNYGCATDWTVWEGDKPLWPSPSDPKWDEYLNALEKVGLKSGKSWGDTNHNELPIRVSWKEIKKTFDNFGMDKATVKIKQVMA